MAPDPELGLILSGHAGGRQMTAIGSGKASASIRSKAGSTVHVRQQPDRDFADPRLDPAIALGVKAPDTPAQAGCWSGGSM